MFSFGSVRHSAWRSVFALLIVSCLSAVLLFTGCKTDEDDDPGPLHGTWKSEYNEVYIIDLNNNKFNVPNTDYPDYAWAGTIKEIGTLNSTSGIIFIEITSKGSSFGTSGSGNITGVYYSDLAGNEMKISTASDAAYKTPVRPTLAEAKALLNVDSLAEYFAGSSAVIRQ